MKCCDKNITKNQNTQKFNKISEKISKLSQKLNQKVKTSKKNSLIKFCLAKKIQKNI